MKSKVIPKYASALMCVAMVALLVAAALPIFGYKATWLRYAYAAAAALILISQFFIPAPGEGFRVRRLARMNVWAGVLYCISAACLFFHDATMQRSWVAFLLGGAVLQIYSNLMLARLTTKK